MRLSFEWDEEKTEENLKKHRVSFAEAQTVFIDPFSVTISDPDHSVDEKRFIDIGRSEKERVLVVVYTERSSIIRTISSRKATPRRRENFMKKAVIKTGPVKDNDMRAEYDFSGGVRGKHYKAMQAGYTITIHNADGATVVKEVMPREDAVVIEPDILAYFPDSISVHRALRCLIPLLPKKKRAKVRRA